MKTLLIGVLIMAQLVARPTTVIAVVAKPEALARPLLKDRVYKQCRNLGYSHEESCHCWDRCYEFLLAHKRGDEWRRPETLSAADVERYLTKLDRAPGKSARGPQQSFNALVILYDYVLGIPGTVNQERALWTRFQERVKALGHADNTAETYWGCIRRFREWLGLRLWQQITPEMLSREPVRKYLSKMANKGRAASNTQNLALQAILYLAKQLYGIVIKGIDADRAKRPQTLPVVLSREEVQKLFSVLSGEMKLAAMLMYGAGLRLDELCSLRRKDIDLDRDTIMVQFAKGKKTRLLPLPKMAKELLIRQLEETAKWHAIDTAAGLARVPLWDAFDLKSSTAESQLANYWVFCSRKRSKDHKTGRIGRYHIDKSNVGRNICNAGRLAKIPKRVHPHCLRHSYATHSLELGMPIHHLQKNLGHNNLETTMIYTHVALTGPASAISPLDSLLGTSHCETLCPACRARLQPEIQQLEQIKRTIPARQHAG